MTALASEVGTKIKAVRTSVGTLSNLTTTAKGDLVSAINEVAAESGGGRVDPWSVQWLTSTWSNSTVTGTDILAGFTPAANTRYIVDVFLIVSSAAATTGIQTALFGPSTGITRSAVKIVSSASITAVRTDHVALNSYQGAVSSLTIPTLISAQAIVDVGATPGAGAIRPVGRSEVAASQVQVFPGSSMRWQVAG